MPQPGSRAYGTQKHKLKTELKDQGVDTDTAEEVADQGVKEMAAQGESTPQADLPPQADPSANDPGQRNHHPNQHG